MSKFTQKIKALTSIYKSFKELYNAFVLGLFAEHKEIENIGYGGK
jgi:hypothetical protein